MKPVFRSLLGCCLLAAWLPVALADSQGALARYEADLKLCHDAASAEVRLQCQRDARAVYDKAMATGTPPSASSAPAPCPECGKVLEISVNDIGGDNSGIGLLAGGAAGAVLGNQIGGGIGKDLATIAGAVGGAYAGRKIEEKMKTRKLWTVIVQYPQNIQNSYEFETDPGLRVGDQVKYAGGTLVRH